ncbi:MAG: hypothetical protein PHV02_20410 [Rhodocyclaceae bacterium]|nr:hypothetical protein [Rhodocyclaceae bacterium]
MFSPITIPFGSKMLFNGVKLKQGITVDDVEVALGEMCNVVKENYGNETGGFIAGQVFSFSGFISNEGSLNSVKEADYDIAIVTYWKSFSQHEKSHADKLFKDKFDALAEMSTRTFELGFDMLWQGVP